MRTEWETPEFEEIGCAPEVTMYVARWRTEVEAAAEGRRTPIRRPSPRPAPRRPRRTEGDRDVGAGAGFGRGRRVPAVELRLPRLPGGAGRARGPPRPHPVVDRGQRRPGALVPVQRLARRPAQIEAFPACTRATAGRRRWRRCCSPTPSSTTPSACCCCARAGRSSCTRRAAAHATLCAGTAVLPHAGALLPGAVARRSYPGTEVSLGDGLSYRAFDVPTDQADRFGSGRQEGRVVGYRVTDGRSGAPLVYLPGVQRLTPTRSVRARRTATACSSTGRAGTTTS